jgi:hypothetical protein
VLTNFIQIDGAPSGAPNQSTVPFPSSSPGSSSFANALQSARAPAPPTSVPAPPAVAGRGKSPEKKTADKSTTKALGQPIPAAGPAVIGDTKATSLIALNLSTMAPPPQVINSSVATVRSTLPPLSSGSDATTGSISQSKPTPTAELASLPSTAAAPAGDIVPFPVAEVGPPPESRSAAEAGRIAAVSGGAVAPSFASRKSAEPSVSNLAVLDMATQKSVAAFAGTAADAHPVPATPPQTAMPLDAAAVKPPAPDSKVQPGEANLNPVPMTPSGAAIVTGADQPASASKARSGSGSGPGGPAALASSVTVSSIVSAVGIAKPIALPAAVVMNPNQTNPAADARAKETLAERVRLSQFPSNQFAPNQESTKAKPADSSPNSAASNAQPPSPGAFPTSAAGPANVGNPSNGAAATANVLAQVSPAASQDSGGRSAAAPAAQLPPPVASPPTTLPTVGPVEAARLVAGVAQSEMHIGLRTQAFGSVEVHTTVRDSQVGLTVGSERGDLRTFLATEVSGLQTTFRQQELRFDNIHFLETSPGTTSGFSGGADSQAGSSSQQHSSPAIVFSEHSPREDPGEVDIGAGSQARLSVHA